MKYVSELTGEKVEAHLLTHRQGFVDFDGNRTFADEGEYLIVSPYMDNMDQESFEKEYQLWEAPKPEQP